MTFTTFVNGNVADADEVNDNFTYAILKKDVMTEDTTEHTGNATLGNAGVSNTWTFTPDNSTNIILGIRVETDIKYSTTDSGDASFYVSLKNNTTNVTIRLGGTTFAGDNDTDEFMSTMWDATTDYVSKSGYFVLHDISGQHNYNSSNTDGEVGSAYTCAMDGASYDISLAFFAGGSTGASGTVTGYVDNTTITIYYFDGFRLTTNSTRFS